MGIVSSTSSGASSSPSAGSSSSNYCERLGIKPGTVINSNLVQSLWAEYSQDSGQIPRSQAKQFLKDLASALSISFNPDVADDIIRDCETVGGTEYLDYIVFAKLFFHEEIPVSLSHSLELQKNSARCVFSFYIFRIARPRSI